MQGSDLLELLKTSPRCGCKLVRALGASALYQLSHNTAHHKQIAWDADVPAAMVSEARALLSQQLQSESVQAHVTFRPTTLPTAELDRLMAHVKHRRFRQGDTLVDRFASNEFVCLLVTRRAAIRTRRPMSRYIAPGGLYRTCGAD
eukprot:1926021-Prymnesium_polylepis.1